MLCSAQGYTPLHGCAETYKHEDMLGTYSATMRFGGFPTITHAELAELLIDHGADPATQNQQVGTFSCRDRIRLCLNLTKVLHDLSSLMATLVSYINLCNNMYKAALVPVLSTRNDCWVALNICTAGRR